MRRIPKGYPALPPSLFFKVKPRINLRRPKNDTGTTGMVEAIRNGRITTEKEKRKGTAAITDGTDQSECRRLTALGFGILWEGNGGGAWLTARGFVVLQTHLPDWGLCNGQLRGTTSRCFHCPMAGNGSEACGISGYKGDITCQKFKNSIVTCIKLIYKEAI